MRFSLRTLFVVMTVLAFGCALLVSLAVLLPTPISHLLIGLFWMAILSVLAVGVVFGRGDKRAFCVGALIVASSVWTDVGGRFMQGVHYFYGSAVPLGLLLWLDLAVLAAVAVAIGWLCVRARHYFER